MKQARRDEDETTGAAKQAGRGDDDGRQDYTMTSNEIGETSTSPRPLTANGADTRRPRIFPRPKGQGTREPIKASTTTRRRHPHGTANRPQHRPSHDAGSGERPRSRKGTPRRFRQLTAQTFPHRHHDAAAERGRRAGQTSENEATGRAEKWQRTTSPKMPTRSHRMRFKGMF